MSPCFANVNALYMVSTRPSPVLLAREVEGGQCAMGSILGYLTAGPFRAVYSVYQGANKYHGAIRVLSHPVDIVLEAS